jgi:hypothetical protein
MSERHVQIVLKMLEFVVEIELLMNERIVKRVQLILMIVASVEMGK